MVFGFGRKLSKSSTPNDTITAVPSPLASIDVTNRLSNNAGLPSPSTVQLVHSAVDDVFAGKEDARAAQDHEKDMTMRYALCHYHIALIWAALMAAPIIMEGYETALVPSFFSFHNFERHYGTNGIISTKWQSGITIAAACGQLVGLWLAPRLVNRLGYRLCTIYGLVWASCCLMFGFWSYNVEKKLAMFLTGEMLLGIPWGLFQGLTLPYVSDITPIKLKGPATTMINIFWLIGQLISASVLRGASEIKNEMWSIKVPMLIQYCWLIPLVGIAFLAPESPLYLSRRGKIEEGLKVIRRLNRDPLCNEQGSLAMIYAINEHEMATSEKMGIRNCLKGVNLRRTEIAVIVYLTQQLIGSPLIFYSVKVLKKGGLTEGSALCVTMGMYFLCILSTISSMAAMRMLGRRAMWLGGLIIELICLLTIGTLGFFLESSNRSLSWGIAALMIIFATVYNFTIGPVCYTIVAETPATRLKAATNALARGIYICVSIANLFLVPNLLEEKPAGWGLGPRAALVWASTTAICLIWAWFRLPEMKDRTPAQIDVMFEQHLNARMWDKAEF